MRSLGVGWQETAAGRTLDISPIGKVTTEANRNVDQLRFRQPGLFDPPALIPGAFASSQWNQYALSHRTTTFAAHRHFETFRLALEGVPQTVAKGKGG